MEPLTCIVRILCDIIFNALTEIYWIFLLSFVIFITSNQPLKIELMALHYQLIMKN